MRAHLLPSWECSLRINLSSSGVKAPFFKLGRRWLVHRSRQLLPHRARPVFFCTEFQFPSPFFFTCSINTASSAAVHGPFFSTSPPPTLPALLEPLLLDPIDCPSLCCCCCSCCCVDAIPFVMKPNWRVGSVAHAQEAHSYVYAC